MRIFILMVTVLVMFLAGCNGVPAAPEMQEGEEDESGLQCRNVTEEIPVVEEICEEVSYTEEVCGIRKLEYAATELPKVDLCVRDGPCVGEPLKNCPDCDKAMSRCVLVITNEDDKEGTWEVGANYTIGAFGFNKEPVSHSIKPNESFAFDFNQLYAPGKPINSARCELFIMEEPMIDDCHDETRTVLECRNVTNIETVVTEVCE
ncbi:hypothetical protein GF318_04225 [Candidatus Micrarchaeota archaeon]|nr:hypothetical protein [Candidatus Micrarchaeota archaeon]